MFIELHDLLRFFAPAERNRLLDAFVYRYIALRWSAKTVAGPESITVWLLWSQNKKA